MKKTFLVLFVLFSLSLMAENTVVVKDVIQGSTSEQAIGNTSEQAIKKTKILPLIYDYANFYMPSERIELQKMAEKLYSDTKIWFLLITRAQEDTIMNYEGSIIKHFGNNTKDKLIVVIRSSNGEYHYVLSKYFEEVDNKKIQELLYSVQSSLVNKNPKSSFEEASYLFELLNNEAIVKVSNEKMGIKKQANKATSVILPILVIAIVLIMLFSIILYGISFVNKKKKTF